MRMKNALLVASLTIIATTGVVYTSEAFADHGQPAAVSERIGHGGSMYSLSMRDGAADCQRTAEKLSRVTVIERIGHGGSTYSFSPLTPDESRTCHTPDHRVTVMERLGHGGSTYSPAETMMN